jgi:hypothetical protein
MMTETQITIMRGIEKDKNENRNSKMVRYE